MKFSSPSPIRVMLALKLIGRMIAWRISPLLLGILVNTTILRAQQPVDVAAADKQTLRVLLQRIDQLEARVKIGRGTRLNSSHGYISYAVFCLKKKKIKRQTTSTM